MSSQIRNQLLERISSGDLAPGARMPSERELSERFEVARTS
ncbi:MAG: GntR family transcriptional regulator, partial [Ilumatobacter sp.]|nr:GntR family transcriptional regulator [Ilumatobacter sp.]